MEIDCINNERDLEMMAAENWPLTLLKIGR
jgi:hypothetical protein